MALRFDATTRARLRAVLMRKGRAVAGDLADLLAGKSKKTELTDLPVFARKPGMRPEERLRAYLDHVESRRKLLDTDDDRFGRCTTCGDEIDLTALEQMPWADTCQRCAPLLSANS